VAAVRAGHPARAEEIAGDLDQVVLRALAKEPTERYGSVDQLCGDLQNWLDNLPVRAGPDSVRRRMRRFARRHRTLMTAAVVTLLALVAGLTTTLWQARRAGLERDRAQQALARSEQVTRFLLGIIESADPREATGDTLTGRVILRLGLARVEELKGQPIVQADVLDALGKVLGSVGQYARATELHLRALALRRSVLGERHPDVAPSLRALGLSLLRRSLYAEAEVPYREALAIQRAALGPDDPRVGETLVDLAFLLPYRSRVAEAESLYREALRIYTRSYGPDDRRTITVRQRLIARIRARDLALAETELRSLLVDCRRALGEDDPFCSVLLFHLGDYVFAQRREDPEAEQLYREGIARIERAEGERHIDLIHGLHSLAALRSARGDFPDAERQVRRAIAINEALYGPAHAATAGSLGLLALMYEDAGRLAEAEAVRLDVLERQRRALGPDHAAIGATIAEIAKLADRQGDHARAEVLWRDAIARLRRSFGDEHASVLRAELQLAATLRALGRTREAAELCAAGVAAVNRVLPVEHAARKEIVDESPQCNWNGAGP